MQKEERALVRAATKALSKLERYRAEHGSSSEQVDAAALDHITTSARWAGWLVKAATEAAKLILARGIGPAEAQRLFYDAAERVQ